MWCSICQRNVENYGCIVCQDGNGYLDHNVPCYGCNFIYCECGLLIPFDTKCPNCGEIITYKKELELTCVHCKQKYICELSYDKDNINGVCMYKKNIKKMIEGT